jgi:hypothetical protein
VSFAEGAGLSAFAAAFYLAGLVFSVLHFPFGATAMTYLNRVERDEGIDGKGRGSKLTPDCVWPVARTPLEVNGQEVNGETGEHRVQRCDTEST